jgi:hypothetical protein
MAAIKGKDGVVEIGVDGSEVAVAQVKSYSITQNVETAETTVMGNDSATHVPTILSWEGSLDLVYDFQDMTRADLRPGSVANLELFSGGSGDDKYEGAIIVTSFEVTGETNDVVGATMNFTGTGDLTRTAV